MDDWIKNTLEETGFISDSVERYKDVSARFNDKTLIQVTRGELKAAIEHDRQVRAMLVKSVEKSMNEFSNDRRFDALPTISTMVQGMFMALIAIADRNPTTTVAINSILRSTEDHDDAGEDDVPDYDDTGE